jgi:D-sedoheptulose 7-phosphate isomerase
MNLDDFDNYTNRIHLAFSKVDRKSIETLISTLNQYIESDARIWIAGNGGSAATASHLATDLSRCKNSKSKPVKGVSLCDNSGLITAISNDFGFKYIFSHQLSNLASAGDLLIVLSASGNSENILEVLGWAKSNQVKTIAMTGFDGGEAKKMADISLHIPTENGDYGVAEDTHSIICHFLSSQFK